MDYASLRKAPRQDVLFACTTESLIIDTPEQFIVPLVHAFCLRARSDGCGLWVRKA